MALLLIRATWVVVFTPYLSETNIFFAAGSRSKEAMSYEYQQTALQDKSTSTWPE
jgi:hypothetical protein